MLVVGGDTNHGLKLIIKYFNAAVFAWLGFRQLVYLMGPLKPKYSLLFWRRDRDEAKKSNFYRSL